MAHLLTFTTWGALIGACFECFYCARKAGRMCDVVDVIVGAFAGAFLGALAYVLWAGLTGHRG